MFKDTVMSGSEEAKRQETRDKIKQAKQCVLMWEAGCRQQCREVGPALQTLQIAFPYH